MTKEEVLAFVKANPVSFLATVDGDKPHVRAMMTFRVDQTGLYFSTFTQKDVYKELTANLAVELCYADAKFENQVRISGRAELLDDEELKKQVVEDFPFLKSVVEEKGYGILGLFRVSGGKATTWNKDKAFEPKEVVDL